MPVLTPRNVFASGIKPRKSEVIQLFEQKFGGVGAVGEDRGAWNVETQYVETDLALYGGSRWRAKRDNIGVTPVEGADWSLWMPGSTVSDGNKGDITVSGGVWTVNPKAGDYFRTSDYSDDVPVAIAACVAAGGGTVEINKRGTIALSAGFVVPGEVELVGLGRDLTRLDFVGVATYGALASGYAVYAKGKNSNATVTLPSFSNIGIGEYKIAFGSAHGLKIGDVVSINDSTDWSFSGYRKYYWKGWRTRVVAIDGNTVYTLHGSPVALTYHATTCFARKIPSRTGKFGGFTIDINGSVVPGANGLQMDYADGVQFDDFASVGAGYTGIYMHLCHGVRATRLVAATKERTSFTGNDYGIIVGNSSHLDIQGDFTGNWAGADVGGGDAAGATHNCNITYFDSRIKANFTAPAAGIHGNTENTVFRNCDIEGGVTLAGKNSLYDSCRLTLTRGQNVILSYASEIHSGVHELRNCDMYSTKDGGVYATLNFGANGGSDNYARGEIFYKVIGGSLVANSDDQPIYVYNNTAAPTAETIHSPEGAPVAGYTAWPTSVHIDCSMAIAGATEALRVRNVTTPGAAKHLIFKQRGPLPATKVTKVSYTASYEDIPA